MGLYNILTNPQDFKFYSGGFGGLSGNASSTPTSFGQRSIPFPSNSTQPYFRVPLPSLTSQNNTVNLFQNNNNPNFTSNQENSDLDGIRYNSRSWGPDFLTRGNVFGLVRSADDVVRLTRYFLDFTKPNGSISGLLFTLKQNILSFLGNDGIYLPTSTIAQAGINLFGFHIRKQGALAGLNNLNSPIDANYDASGIKEDFRKFNPTTGSTNIGSFNTFSSLAPSYKTTVAGSGNIEKRVKFKSGGRRGNISDYTQGKREISTGELLGPIDLINALPIYEASEPILNESTKDLIDFRIAVLNNKTIGESSIKKFYLHFRAFLDGFGDAYTSEWKPIEYVGRAEKFYRYSGFNRTMDVSFTIAASSKEELMPMYKKLNFLASSFAPTYSDYGYMMGNLVQLTVGNYIYEQTGFFTALDIEIPDSAPFEINIGLDGEPIKDMRQVPLFLKVKLKFTPIHQFRPEIQKLTDPSETPDKEPTGYGIQRYISLEDGKNGYQGSYDSILPPTDVAAQDLQSDNILSDGVSTEATDPSTNSLELVNQNRNSTFLSNNSIVSNN